MSDAVVRLAFPAKADYLLLARLALSGVARDVRIDEDQLAELKLAVTEACGNAVRHAYSPHDGGMVDVSFALDGARFVMTVEDQGEGIEPPDLEPVETDDAPLDSGMGMTIIRAIVDELDVEAGADGRGAVVRMTKFLDA